MQNSKVIHFFISLVGGFIIWFLLILFTDLSAGLPKIQRFLQIFGGSYDGYIQALTIALFIFGLLQLIEKQKEIKLQYQAFHLNLLPLEENIKLTPAEVEQIGQEASVLEKRSLRYLLVDLIKKACNQYRNEYSIGDTLQVLDSQIDTSKNETEGSLELVRYVINAIASLGFIGTVIGLSTAIGLAHLAKTEQGMPEITKHMNVAFDTTLVALLFGLILNFYYHRYLGHLDTFYSRTKSYIITNLISRIKNV